MSMKTLDKNLIEAHLTFAFSSGAILAEDEISFSAIDINKALLTLKFTNAPQSILGSWSLVAEYFDYINGKWIEMARLTQSGMLGLQSKDEQGIFDITTICRNNPKFRWRVGVWGPFLLFYSCMTVYASLHLEYTGGETSVRGYTINSFLGGETGAIIGELLSLMINLMFITMIISMMMTMMGGMTEAV
ncbi:MAG: hypothetical protein QXK24_08865 [Ignisphaera sp.]